MAKKRKYQKGREVDSVQGMNKMPGIPGMYQAPRDSVFTNGNYITTDPRTGLIKEGKDPMSPRQRLEQMAIKNIETDRINREEERWHNDMMNEKADRMVDEIIMKEEDVPSAPVERVPTPELEEEWEPMMHKRRDTIRKNPNIPLNIPYGTKNPKAGPGYGRGGMLKRGGSVKSGSKGRNGVL